MIFLPLLSINKLANTVNAGCITVWKHQVVTSFPNLLTRTCFRGADKQYILNNS